MLTVRLAATRSIPDALVVPVVATEGGPVIPAVPALPEDARAEAVTLLADAPEPAGAGTITLLPRPGGRPELVLLAGVGATDPAGGVPVAGWRAAGAAVRRAATSQPPRSPARGLTIGVPADAGPDAVRGLAEALWLAAYRFVAEPRPGAAPAQVLRRVTLAVDDPGRYAAALEMARDGAEATRWARDMTNTPGSRKSPDWFARQVAGAAADRAGVTVTVRGPAELAAAGFGGVLAVAGGSV
ncbi:MAG TPA: peptidase M17, partial [Pilimelia sp.]|nr:peptidase M17 [Pilimelia sp.]